MEIVYKKSGKVSVQDVNLLDPLGKPLSLEIDFIGEKMQLGVKAWDNLNDIGRTYELEMDEQFKGEFTQFFFVSIARIMRENYDEFQNIELK